MIISQRNAQNIVDDMKSAINYDINIMDEKGYIIASTDPGRCGQLHEGAARLLREEKSSLVITEDDAIGGSRAGINMPITLGRHTIGVVGITGSPEEVSRFGGVVKKMAEVMVKSIQEEESSDLLDSAKSLFIESLLFSRNPNWSELEIRGRLLGLNITQPYTVAILQRTKREGASVFNMEETQARQLRQMVGNHLQKDDCFFIFRDRIIVFLCKAERNAAFYTVNRICQDVEAFYGGYISCGISNATITSPDIRRCYLEAQAASAVAAQRTKRRVVFYDEASLEFIAQSIPVEIMQSIRELVFAGCSEAEKAEFTETIETFFKYDGNMKECAENLIIHRNTYQYHIERLNKKTSFDLRKPKDATLLYLAMWANTIE